jgi:ribosomal protein L37AE/L43A
MIMEMEQQMEQQTVKSIVCSECKGKMYRLPESKNNTYVCEQCGHSIELPEVSPESDCNLSLDSRGNENIDEGQRSIERLFNSNFMRKYTKYDTFADFIKECNLLPDGTLTITYEIFKEFPKEEFDEFVRQNTVFESWDEMFERASGRFLKM